MKCSVGDEVLAGVVSDGSIAELEGRWRHLLASCGGDVPPDLPLTGRSWPIEECVLRAPIPDSRPIFCMGFNYREHEAEAGSSLGLESAAQPVVFVKQPEAMADPDEKLSLDPELSAEFDWEVELAVVIGKPGRGIAPDRVREHIAGYSIVNDVTARDLQRSHVQWFIGKNIHHSSPVGPWIVTADEIAYPPDLLLTMSVNGTEKQRARTAELVFDINAIISTVSRYVELQAGDVFATGTPAGTGFTRTPPEFLRSGDVMVAEIEAIGRLQNGVR